MDLKQLRVVVVDGFWRMNEKQWARTDASMQRYLTFRILWVLPLMLLESAYYIQHEQRATEISGTNTDHMILVKRSPEC